MDSAIAPEQQVVCELDPQNPAKIIVYSGLRDKELVKMVPGANWNRRDGLWRVRRSWAACVQLWGVFGPRMAMGEALSAWMAETKPRVDYLLWLRQQHDVPDWDEPDLYPMQKVGALFIYYAGGALLGDEVGAGKTRQIIKALELKDAYPAVVIAPKSVKGAWLKEYGKVAPHRTVVNVTGSAAQRRKLLALEADVYVVHWDIVRLHSRLAGYGNIALTDDEKEPKELNMIAKKALIVDEGHRMQDPKAKQTRGVWQLADEVDPAGLKVVATGTPVEKGMDDAWPQLRCIAPDEFPSKSAYIDRYAFQSWNPFGFTQIAGLKPERKQEFFEVIDPHFIRRPRKIVVPDVPDPIRMPPRMVELTGKQKKAYEDFRKELMAEVEGGILMAKNPLARMGRLRQFAAASIELTMNEKTGEADVRLIEPSAVLDELEDVLKELGDKQALIFSESRQLMELCFHRVTSERGLNRELGLITGAVNEADRNARVDEFQAGRLQYVGLTMGAGGEGLTLTNASAMIFIERSFSLKKNTQAEGRAVRPGQSERCLIIDIVPHLTDSKGNEVPTIYGHVLDTIVEKGESAEEVLRDNQTISRWLTK